MFLRQLFNRATRRPARRTATAPASVELLEQRQVLSATVLQPLPGLTLTDDQAVLSLADHFDDPDVSGSTVRVETSFGAFAVETYDTVTPQTVDNFLRLVENGNYADSFIHRTVPGFVAQGGGFRWPTGADSVIDTVSHNGNVVNEFDNWFSPNAGGLAPGTPLNVRGTVAMAKQAGDPNSANSQWFVNATDNSENLDDQNGGFTVFARVLYDGMDVIDQILALPRFNAGGAFESWPLQNFTPGSDLIHDNVVSTSFSRVNELTFEITDQTNAAIATAEIANGELRITPVSGQSGFTQITISATDLQGTTVSSVLDVAVGTALPSAISGPGNTTHRRPEIRWAPVHDALEYELWVNHAGGRNAIIHNQSLTDSHFTPADPLPTGDFVGWVRVRNALGWSDWSSPHSFRINEATPSGIDILSPDETAASELRPAIRWQASPEATSYDLWVNHVGHTNQIIRQTALTGNSYVPSFDLPDGTYRAWVMAKNETGDSGWSAGHTFIVDAGVLRIVGPIGRQATSRPTIAWNGAADGAVTELWVNQIGGTGRIIHRMDLTTSVLIPDADLPDGDYRAWIRQRTLDGPAGDWSAPFDFTVGLDTTPGEVTLNSIAGLDSGMPRLEWSAADHAVRYELWINQVGGASRVIHTTAITELQYAATVSLPAGTFRGWLRAFNADGETGAWSGMFEFEIS